MKHLAFILSITFIFIGRLFAQVETTVPSLRGMYQSSYINPAFVEYKTVVGLPVFNNLTLGLNLNISGFNVHMIARNIDAEKNLDVNSFYKDLNGPVGIKLDLATDLFYVRFRIRSYFIGLNSTLKVNQASTIGKEVFGLADNLNNFSDKNGQQFDLVALNVNVYNETGLSITKKYRRWTFGGRVKYLNGIANVHTDQVKFIINASTDTLEIKIAGKGQSAGAPFQGDSLDGKWVDSTDKLRDFDPADLYSFKNTGFGFDFGATYRVNNKLTVHASVTDLGSSITWRNKTYTYNLNQVSYKFSGVTLDQIQDTNYFSHIQDSLVIAYKKSTGISSSSYSTEIPTKYFAGADYDLTKRNRVGFLFQGIQYKGSFYPTYTFSYMHRFGQTWQVLTNYSFVNNTVATYNAVGFGTMVKWGAFQVYMIQDNLLAFIDPARAQNFNFVRLGFSLVWGEIPKKVIYR